MLPQTEKKRVAYSMNSKDRKAKIRPGAAFMVSGKQYMVVTVEDTNAVVQDVKTGKRMNYGVDALARLNITFQNK